MFNATTYSYKDEKTRLCSQLKHEACSKSIRSCGPKIELLTCRSETLILFKVLSLRMHRLLRAFIPLLEVFMKDLSGNGVQLDCHVMYNVLSWFYVQCPLVVQIRSLSTFSSAWGTANVRGSHIGEYGAGQNTGMLCLAKKVCPKRIPP
ncbi:hypothetical protein BsWGS_08032 [Bradybaena similaris]